MPPPSSHESAQITVSRVSSWNRVIASDGLIGRRAAFGPPLTVWAWSMLVRTRVLTATHHRTTSQTETANTTHENASATPSNTSSRVTEPDASSSSNTSFRSQPASSGLR